MYSEQMQEMRKMHTPNQRTVEEVAGFVGVPPQKLVKTLLYAADGKVVAALIRGDRELNEVKFRNLLKCDELVMADEEIVKKVTHAPVGFAGPIGLSMELYADIHVKDLKNFVVGANEEDMHYVCVNLARDFAPKGYYDLSIAVSGDRCGKCGQELKFFRGIEVGHIFFLGTKYSKPMECNFLSEEGIEKPAVMGCYGIGVTRIIQAAIEQNNDGKGMIFPVSIAPFHSIIVLLNTDDKRVALTAERIYSELIRRGCEVLIDDRNESPGVKLNDADLIGIPFQIIAGRKSVDRGEVEFRRRDGKTKPQMVKIEESAEKIFLWIQEEIKKYEV
jgi:prolyl-tRNA synthetase